MSPDGGVDTAAVRPAGLTRIEPASFRGVDCKVLAERYAAYRRNMGLDARPADADVIEPAAAPGKPSP
ncbi:hypothetical protein [Aestuariivirga sp.]|uniref:hypothetical protein n=1 Tax=Aestuariivirga sp. TaxID=2650926 RepID=UPI0025C3DFF7|nr:hypothetical protein [Aestuariivirga sp.]MCA3556489.1 hypothetical protein [Aestuariivirga sp.]